MTQETFFPYTFDPNVLPLDESQMLDEKLGGGQADLTRVATQNLRGAYDQRLSSAASWLQNISGSETALQEVLMISSKKVDDEFVRTITGMPLTVALGDNVMKRVATRLRPSGMGQEIMAAAAAIWSAQGPVIWKTLSTINTVPVPAHAQFTPKTWDVVVDVITRLFDRIQQSYREDTPPNVREKLRAASQLATPLLSYMTQIGATSHASAYAAANEIIDAWCMSSLVAQVHPILEQIAAIIAGPDIEHDQVRVPRYLDMIHNNDSVLSMNKQLLRYMRDIGVSDFKINDVPKLDTSNMGDMERAHHYANDLYQVYKLIVRDTLLFQFRSAQDHLPEQVQDRWNDAHLPAIDVFLQDLLFTPLAGLVGKDFDSPEEVRRIVTTIPVDIEKCTLKSALGDEAYVQFLRDAAQDCGDRAQVRTETLLRYIASDAFRNLASVSGASVVNSSAYKSIIDVLDHVAGQVTNMSKNILTVFALLNDPNVKSSFLETDQANAGAVLTFVKIRNDNPDYGNRRFDIHLDSHARAIMVKYEMQPLHIYENFMSRKHARGGGLTARQRKPYDDAIKVAMAMPQGSAKARALKEAKAALVAADRTGVTPSARSARAADTPAVVKITPGRTPVSNPTGLNKAGPVAHVNGVRQEFVADETLPTPEGTGEHVVPRGDESTYVFGPFTRVYKPHETSRSMAKAGEPEARTIQSTVVSRLLRGQNVCIFGYGQSGSGKTSYLIYRKDSDTTGELGVMSYICEHLIPQYDRLQCDIREIGVTKSGVEVLDGTSNPFYASKIFTPKDGTWVMSDDDFANLPPLRKISADTKGEQTEVEEQRDTPTNYIPRDMLRDLGRYVFFSTENKRSTKATTNNPTSSRSHVFVFLRFLSRSGPSPVLVIGDFAGVENKFACDNSTVLRAFANVKKYTHGDFAYKPEIEKAYANSVIPLITGSPFEGVTFTQLQDFEGDAKRCESRPVFKQLAEKALSISASEMSAGVAFADTTIGHLITTANEIRARKSQWELFRSNTGSLSVLEAPVYAMLSKSKYMTAFYWAQRGVVRLQGGMGPSNSGPESLKLTKPYIVNMVKPYGALLSIDVAQYELLKVCSQLFMGSECSNRVQEGIYINNSLETFRNFLSSSLHGKSVPKILNECGAIQCNPLFQDCFGSSFASQLQMGVVEETLVKMIAPTAGMSANPAQRILDAHRALSNLTFCIFNVINISKDRNDPPPSPFIDSSPVVYEYNRAASVATRAELPSVTVSGEPFNQSVGGLFDIEVLRNLATRVQDTAQQARDALATQGGTNLGQAVTAANDVERDAIQVINSAIAAAGGEGLMPKVREVIDTFERINSSTFIGTLIFTDTLAKFGMNRMMCVMPKGASYLDASVFGNVKRLTESMNKIMCDGLLRGSRCGSQ